MTTRPELCGTVAPGFEPVADAFTENFDVGPELGAACAVYVDGTEVVNLWAGTADQATGRPWDDRTVAMVASTTKGATAVCAAILVERGVLDVDRPVADYWPEFARAGKADIPVRMLLNHQAGLPVVDATLTVEDILAGGPVVEALAAQAPVWPPGTRHGYHAMTYGWLVGEVVRRISGRSLGRFFAEEVAAPLGLSFWIGIPEEHLDRIAPVFIPPEDDPDGPAAEPLDLDSLALRATTMNGVLNVLDGDEVFDRRWHMAEIPAGNGIADARSIARLYAACVGTVDGVRLLGDDTVRRVGAEQSRGIDALIGAETRFGLGFWLPIDEQPLLGPSSFGHPGAGGSIGFADLDARVGFGYVPNRMGSGMGDPRRQRLIDALQSSLS